MDAKEFKTEVKKLLVEHGWTKGTFQNDEGAYCLGGAVNAVRNQYAFKHPFSWQAYLEVQGELMERIKKESPYNSISAWNDRPETTFEDILRVLK